MLQSTTILAETATVAGATGLTAKTAVKYEVDEKGNKTAILVNKKRAIAELAEMLDAKGAELELSEQTALGEIETKQPYVKK